MERLSTGLRINSAADDAAGLQISNRLEMQNRGMSVAMRNAQDGISLLQTAEGAMDEMTNIAYRMNDLATQSANGTNTAADRTALDAEFQQLGSELNNIIKNTNFGGRSIFDGADTGSLSQSSVQFQIGSTTNETLTVDVQSQLQSVGTALESYTAFKAGQDAYQAAYDASLAATPGDTAAANTAGEAAGTAAIQALPAGDFGTDFSTATYAGLKDSHSINSSTGATNSMDSLSNLIDGLGAARSQFGANINRLDHTITNLQNMSENLAASKGRITDADFAVESANMTKNQMLMQAGTQMLAQSKQLPGMAMSLLG
jgi:flagellin